MSAREVKGRLRLAIACLLLTASPACAIAFTTGTKPAPAPEKFPEADESSHEEQENKEQVAVTKVPTFGVSLVVGGKKFDAGGLPPPPIPVVLLP